MSRKTYREWETEYEKEAQESRAKEKAEFDALYNYYKLNKPEMFATYITNAEFTKRSQAVYYSHDLTTRGYAPENLQKVLLENDVKRKIYDEVSAKREHVSSHFFLQIEFVHHSITKECRDIERVLQEKVFSDPAKFDTLIDTRTFNRLKELRLNIPAIQNANSVQELRDAIKEEKALEKLKILDRHGVFASAERPHERRGDLPADIGIKILTEHYHKPNFGL